MQSENKTDYKKVWQPFQIQYKNKKRDITVFTILQFLTINNL